MNVFVTSKPQLPYSLPHILYVFWIGMTPGVYMHMIHSQFVGNFKYESFRLKIQ